MARRPIDHPNVVGSRRILIFIPSLRTVLRYRNLDHRTPDPSCYRPLDLSLIDLTLGFSFVRMYYGALQNDWPLFKKTRSCRSNGQSQTIGARDPWDQSTG